MINCCPSGWVTWSPRASGFHSDATPKTIHYIVSIPRARALLNSTIISHIMRIVLPLPGYSSHAPLFTVDGKLEIETLQISASPVKAERWHTSAFKCDKVDPCLRLVITLPALEKPSFHVSCPVMTTGEFLFYFFLFFE